MTKISIPAGAAEIISTLQENGYKAYVVGGCVRDSILGKAPKDWDICTSAKPDDVIRCFRNYPVIETGLQHGTVTVLIDHEPFEVTTFRVDGEYADSRRPSSVRFITDVKQDLARRDFTINAMAYNDEEGLIDPFGGASDLACHKISCVCNPDERFGEDALRIMRALRFASVYGFSIAESTAEAIHRNRSLLHNIAAERITMELSKLVCGNGVLDVLLRFSDVMTTIIPELGPCIGFDQNNKYHCYTIYEHIAVAVWNSPSDDLVVRMALLLHDIGKPCCYTEDENGGHFHGHGEFSYELAKKALSGLRFDNKTRHSILTLVLHHDAQIEPTPKTVRRWLNRIGAEQFARLLKIRMADIKAHSPDTQASRIERCKALEVLLTKEQEHCFSLKDLEVNGRDMIAIGIPEGKRIGDVLAILLNEVINGSIPNDKSLLTQRAAEIVSSMEVK